MIISAENLSVQFSRGAFKKKIKALDSFSLTVEQGDIFALLGPNGAGKRVFECTLKRQTLEDSFFKILKEGNGGQKA